MIEGLEERLVLSTILWDSVNQPAGGSWDTASNWVGGQIPQSTDDAVIDLTGPGTITLDAGATNDVNSLTTNANTSISIVNDTLSLATASSMGGGLVQSGGTLTGPGTLTVTGLTTWTGGTMSGSGITNANGGMTIGDAGSSDQMFLDQRTLNNAGTATIADEASYYPYGLLLSSAPPSTTSRVPRLTLSPTPRSATVAAGPTGVPSSTREHFPKLAAQAPAPSTPPSRVAEARSTFRPGPSAWSAAASAAHSQSPPTPAPLALTEPWSLRTA